MEPKMPSLEILNDDVLLQVIAILHEYSTHRDQNSQHFWQPKPYLKNFSATNWRNRNLAAPTVLRNVKIAGYWENVAIGLKVMEKSTRMLEHARYLRVHVYNTNKDSKELAEGLSSRLGFILQHTRKLESLRLQLPHVSSPLISATLETIRPSLPTLKALSLGGSFEFVIKYCPAVESILCDASWPFPESQSENRARTSHFLQLAGQAKNLEYFEIQARLDVKVTEDICKFLPQVTTLAITGGFQGHPPGDYVPVLARLQKLKHLVLAGLADLRVGFREPAFAGAYDGPDGDSFFRSVQAERERVSDQVARRMFDGLPKLEGLWIGRSPFGYGVGRDKDGNVLEVKPLVKERQIVY